MKAEGPITIERNSLPACPPTQTSFRVEPIVRLPRKKSLSSTSSRRNLSIFFFGSFFTFRFFALLQPSADRPSDPVSCSIMSPPRKSSETHKRSLNESKNKKNQNIKKELFGSAAVEWDYFFHLFMNVVQIFILRLHPLLIIFNNCVLCFVFYCVNNLMKNFITEYRLD